MNKLIAVVGMAGSGKSLVCDHLEKNNYKKIYFGGVTMNILKEKGMAVTPENEKTIREALRKEYGMAAYAIKLLPEIRETLKERNVVLDGLYSWDELKVLQEEFPSIIVLAIVVDKNFRYKNISKRRIRPLTFEEVKNRDISEIENLAKGGPIAYADYYILANGTKDDLYNDLDKVLEKIK